MALLAKPLLTTRAALAACIVALVASTEAALFTLPPPPAIRDIVQVIVGVLIAKLGTVYDYYFGSSKDTDAGSAPGRP